MNIALIHSERGPVPRPVTLEDLDRIGVSLPANVARLWAPPRNAIERIVCRLGGIRSVANDLTLPASCVEGWISEDFVPEWRRMELKRLARRRKRPLSDGDFPAARRGKVIG